MRGVCNVGVRLRSGAGQSRAAEVFLLRRTLTPVLTFTPPPGLFHAFFHTSRLVFLTPSASKKRIKGHSLCWFKSARGVTPEWAASRLSRSPVGGSFLLKSQETEKREGGCLVSEP
jgi:hypothetical protein